MPDAPDDPAVLAQSLLSALDRVPEVARKKFNAVRIVGAAPFTVRPGEPPPPYAGRVPDPPAWKVEAGKAWDALMQEISSLAKRLLSAWRVTNDNPLDGLARRCGREDGFTSKQSIIGAADGAAVWIEQQLRNPRERFVPEQSPSPEQHVPQIWDCIITAIEQKPGMRNHSAVAKEAGYPFNSNFRTAMLSMKAAALIDKQRGIYIVLKSRDKSQDRKGDSP